MSFLSRIFLFLVLLGLSAAFSASAFAEPPCSSYREQLALNTRIFQSELMVAALSCGQQQQYNEFVERFESLLAARGRDMRSFFVRNYGAGLAEKKLNDFVTRVANDAARRGLDIEEGAYCAMTRQRFSNALAASTERIDSMILQNDFETLHELVACKDNPDGYRLAETAAGGDK